jgi:FMN phosphatase YigB (HAD superfamily)
MTEPSDKSGAFIKGIFQKLAFQHRIGKAVTFDCWGTLLFQHDPTSVYKQRIDAVQRAAIKHGVRESRTTLLLALDHAWRKHWEKLHEATHSGPLEISCWTLEELSINDSDTASGLASEFIEIAVESDIAILEGAGATLEELASAGIHRALICDTGFCPGAGVRTILQQVGLLDLLELQIFSDEIGVPKPHATMFRAALDPLNVSPSESVHVGDMLRTDIAGAREIGMGTIRIRDQHDDLSDHAEADAVADDHPHLRKILDIESIE